MNDKDQVVGYGIVDGLITLSLVIFPQLRRYGLGYGREIVFEKNLLVVGIELIVVHTLRSVINVAFGTRLVGFAGCFFGFNNDLVNTLHLHVVRILVITYNREVAVIGSIAAEIAQMHGIVYIRRIIGIIVFAGRLFVCTLYNHKRTVLRGIRPSLFLRQGTVSGCGSLIVSVIPSISIGIIL